MVKPINWDQHSMKKPIKEIEEFSEIENLFTAQVLVRLRTLP
jgi:hypothetical protein